MDAFNRRDGYALAALTFVHAGLDMYGGTLPALLPLIRQEFGLSLSAGVALISVLNLSSNVVQLVSGHWRARRATPVFLYLGPALAMVLALIGFVPRGPWAYAGLCALCLVAGTGIALAHPEALRGLHALKRIPASLGTAILMTGGYLGFASGAWLAAVVAEWRGLSGLLGFWFISVAGLVLLRQARIKLAVEPARVELLDGRKDAEESGAPVLPFGAVLAMAIPVAIGSSILPAFLPTFLHERGFSLSFGGLASLIFGGGGALGGLLWAVLANRRGLLPCARISLLLGIPLVVGYLLLDRYAPAVGVLALAGFCVNAAFPLLVTLARHARGPKLGVRMGWMVGGSWGAASVVLMLLGPVAERVGTAMVLHLSWVFYLAAAVQLIWVARKYAPAPGPACH